MYTVYLQSIDQAKFGIALFTGRFIYKGDTSTDAQGTDMKVTLGA